MLKMVLNIDKSTVFIEAPFWYGEHLTKYEEN